MMASIQAAAWTDGNNIPARRQVKDYAGTEAAVITPLKRFCNISNRQGFADSE
ncbi:hypothetical protein AGMMS50256_13730 [Betaproteobacteria bacterium]|nr:hypothetical protein AGMMS50256_13730 [Betaproteobacteria bacterium]